MAKKETMYDIIFDIYELKDDSIQKKEKYRKLIKRRFEKLFHWKNWEELSQTEKNTFVYIDLKEDMFHHYVTENTKQKRIAKKIDEKLREILCPEYLMEHNRKNANMFRTDYYKPEDSDTPKRKAYAEFCRDLSAINSRVPIPGFDEWIQQNERARASEQGRGLRIYDYVMDFYYNPGSQNAESKNKVSQTEVDHVVVEILKKKIEEELGIEINIPKIQECLSFIKNNEFEEFEEMPTEYDSSPETEKNISKEEQQKYIEDSNRYFMYLEMLRNLEFVEKKETTGKE